jgi:hypothetical protein
MTPEQELKAHQLLDQKLSEMPSRLDPKAAAKYRREAQKRVESEAKALEAQQNAALKAQKQAASEPRPSTPPATLAQPPFTPQPPLNSQPYDPRTEAERAHEQAMKNAAATAKTQLQDRSKEQSGAVATPSSPAVEKQTAMPAPKLIPSEPVAVKPIPLPVSGSKQQRLTQLLEAYRRDQITPAQYHSERARILAEP